MLINILKMFIYLVAVVATLFIIFGLVHARCLKSWIGSSVPSSFCDQLTRRPQTEASLDNEDLESTFATGRSLAMTDEIREFEDLAPQGFVFGTKERSSDVFIAETGSKSRNLNPPRYSFENLLSGERDIDLGLPATRNLQLGTTKDDEAIKTTKQEGKENLFESLKNSLEKGAFPPSRLNTSQIYNLIVKETLKDNAAKRKLLEIERIKFNESLPIKLVEQLPSSSENEPEQDTDINGAEKSDD
ncbi:uncharacterized protein LOC122404753 [Colletes gigas]|uniref:uncharacterized protein LOC122404753 n=1 Tax=Colletes gigas TaxID=935657 RepID=UPI001C9A685A|nr:uncharacterized protein LOC122404753 [Colletes gigas]